MTVVHPPHVALITRAHVMTDKLAAFTLAISKGLLTGIWVPPAEVRDLRGIIAQRSKMTRLATQAKNRRHAVLQCYHRAPPEGSPFLPERRDWWLNLPVSVLERQRIACDLDTLAFAAQQVAALNQTLTDLAGDEERLVRLLQLPGISQVTALTILGAVGDITRFPHAKHLVGYAGLGARIHDSGLTSRSGKITKAGRRDLRAALVESAQTAANTHPHWQAELARLEPRLGRNKAIVAIARKLLVAVWHVLTEGVADRHAAPERVARKLLQHAYRLGRTRRPDRQSLARMCASSWTACIWAPTCKPSAGASIASSRCPLRRPQIPATRCLPPDPRSPQRSHPDRIPYRRCGSRQFVPQMPALRLTGASSRPLAVAALQVDGRFGAPADFCRLLIRLTSLTPPHHPRSTQWPTGSSKLVSLPP